MKVPCDNVKYQKHCLIANFVHFNRVKHSNVDSSSVTNTYVEMLLTVASDPITPILRQVFAN